MKNDSIMEDKLQKRTYYQLMVVNILISLIQPCNQLIDSMLTGNGLGVESLESYALFFPVGSLVVALSSVFSVGTQINASHMLGRGESESVKKLLRTAFLSSTVFAVTVAIMMSVFSSQFAVLLGASSNIPRHISDMSSCLLGYAPGIPAIFLMNIMMSLLQIEGKKHFVVVLSVCNLFINWIGDVVNLTVFKGGLFGMTLATSVANIVVCVILLIYYLFYSKMFRFSLAGFSGELFRRIIKNGFPSLSYYGSLVIRSMFFNYLIVTMLDPSTLAVLLVVNAFTSVVDAAIGGTGDAVLLLGGVLFGERDILGQKKLIRMGLISGSILLLVITVISFIAAVPIAALFSDNSEMEFIKAAASAVSLTSISFVPDVIACVLKKYIQSVGAARYTSFSNVLCNVVYVCLSAVILVNIIGSDGIFLSYSVCYTLIIFTHIIFALLRSKKNKCRGADILLFLPEDYDITPDDVWETTASNLEDCIRASLDVSEQCRKRGLEENRSHHISLFTEEITKNIVEHGFRPGKNNLIVIKLIIHRDGVMLIIKDNCLRFNPKHYYDLLDNSSPSTNNIGIRVVMGLAKKSVYTNSFSLNNLMIEI